MWRFSHGGREDEHLLVTADNPMELLGSTGDGGQVDGELGFDLVDDELTLTGILASPSGAGLGAVLVYCFADLALGHGHQRVWTRLPGFDVTDFYTGLGFIQDPLKLQDALATSMVPERMSVAEFKIATAGFPLVADASELRVRARTSFEAKGWSHTSTS
ncbi:hypothetical protein [Umezawaea sp. Da 62-37]|uniref:hypothetical protein n=1 Tax=Umezawaea sp. Da 62-37 TaxID=3075927 RepID=UPI0028F6D5A3|nr:hypothetical protein [Umezawaea sp. Da 62-37]WNV87987.1 hypothetical protein RM788_06785 [Umezawaea sp. Da 62-37]